MTGDAAPALWRTLDAAPTRVIAHRGASGERPEHSPAAYLLALDQGADWLEPDLVPSRDGVLVVRHDAGLARSTQIAGDPWFSGRLRTEPQFAESPADWWAHDFSWQELSRLKCRQPWADRDGRYDGQQSVLRLEQVLALAQLRQPRPTIYPELKHPAEYRALGLDPAALVIRLLADPVIRDMRVDLAWQCFDADTLAQLAEAGVPRLTQLYLPGDSRPTSAGLPGHVHALGIPRAWLRAPDAEAWVDSIHSSGRELHAWTFRERSASADLESPDGLWRAFELGIDAVFCDWPSVGIAQRARWVASPAQCSAV